jgi:hypothetical protein
MIRAAILAALLAGPALAAPQPCQPLAATLAAWARSTPSAPS